MDDKRTELQKLIDAEILAGRAKKRNPKKKAKTPPKIKTPPPQPPKPKFTPTPKIKPASDATPVIYDFLDDQYYFRNPKKNPVAPRIDIGQPEQIPHNSPKSARMNPYEEQKISKILTDVFEKRGSGLSSITIALPKPRWMH